MKRKKIVIDEERIEIAIAWMKGEITSGQVAFALDKANHTGNILYVLAVILREAYTRGFLKIK